MGLVLMIKEDWMFLHEGGEKDQFVALNDISNRKGVPLNMNLK